MSVRSTHRVSSRTVSARVGTSRSFYSNMWKLRHVLNVSRSFVPQIKVTASFTVSSVNISNLTTYTFAATSIGSPSIHRKVVIAVTGGTAAVTVSSVTVGGISASLVVSRANGSLDVELWQAEVPTGTSVTVEVVWSSANIRCGIGVFAVYDAKNSNAGTITTITDPMSVNIATPLNGVVIAAACDDSGSVYTWTGLPESYDETLESNTSHTGAFDVFSSIQTGYNVKCDPSNAAISNAMVVAKWKPR